jgi:hypothetical protein
MSDLVHPTKESTHCLFSATSFQQLIIEVVSEDLKCSKLFGFAA